jgi:hypothetical protein
VEHALAFAAEKWLPESERQECLRQNFHKVAIACLAPGVASILRRIGAIRRLPAAERGNVQGGSEFAFGVAMLEAYLLLEHQALASVGGSFLKDMYDVLGEIPRATSDDVSTAGEELRRLLPAGADDAKPDFDRLRVMMDAATGELATLRQRRTALHDLITQLNKGVRDRGVLRPLAEIAGGGPGADGLLEFVGENAGRRRVIEITSDEAACPVCYMVFPVAMHARFSNASTLQRCTCGVFLVRSLDT